MKRYYKVGRLYHLAGGEDAIRIRGEPARELVLRCEGATTSKGKHSERIYEFIVLSSTFRLFFDKKHTPCQITYSSYQLRRRWPDVQEVTEHDLPKFLYMQNIYPPFEQILGEVQHEVPSGAPLSLQH